MRTRLGFAMIVGIVGGCGETGTDHIATIDAASVDAAGDGCASPPTGDWAGVASILLAGAGSSGQVSADVHWTPSSSSACVDRYQPSGTASYTFHGGNCHVTIDPSSVAIQPSDGDLVLDRTTSPPTYRMTGATRWDAVMVCEGEPPGSPAPIGGTWADAHGWFDGAVIGGGVDGHATVIDWRLARVDAVFPPPGQGCSEPASDHWSGTASYSGGASATLTWARVSTDGCVDRFEPTGVAGAPTVVTGCKSLTFDPASFPVGTADGALRIDRSTNPATFQIVGATLWQGAATCTLPDGSTVVYSGQLGGEWGFFGGAFDGDRFGGGTVGGEPSAFEWSLSRLE